MYTFLLIIKVKYNFDDSRKSSVNSNEMKHEEIPNVGLFES